MNADIKWLDNPEIFRINQSAAHSDHNYFLNYEIIYNYNGVEDTCSSLCELDENKKYDYIILF